jgi:hypothetical protein
MTEFWVAGREDQVRTAEFVESPEFSILDEDDRRFLDVTRRLSFEVEELVLSTSKQGGDPPHPDRLAMFIARPAANAPADFAAEVIRQARAFAATHDELCDRVSLDLRVSGASQQAEQGFQAILSAWPSAARDLRDLVWPEIEAPSRMLRLESVESASEALFRDGEFRDGKADPELAKRISVQTRPDRSINQERESR